MTRKIPDLRGLSLECVYDYYTHFDSEVSQLVADLGLVRIGSPAFAARVVALQMSRYSKYWFCERVLDQRRQKELDTDRLIHEYYKRNKKYSRYVHDSFDCQSEIRWED